ncbi:zinc finger domain-containing protein [Paracoccus niistensis]|uniref:DNA-binding phage zinc finger domain-containing protein n=1 Tax=Paracoccus niistensis TaxID=632935 RepID=A0ABV6I6V3_9RHOB
MPDFTEYNHPVLAVACPTCRAAAGAWCHCPSGHRAADFHAARRAEADRQFIAQHGDLAAIIHAASGWLIDPRGRARD